MSSRGDEAATDWAAVAQEVALTSADEPGLPPLQRMVRPRMVALAPLQRTAGPSLPCEETADERVAASTSTETQEQPEESAGT